MLKEIRIGVISSSHGIKGEAKVFPTTDDIEHFKNIKSCTLVSEDLKVRIELKLEYTKPNKNMLICKFSQINTPEELLKYRGFSLYVDRETLPKPKSNENYIGDLIGLDVISDTGERLGVVKDVFPTGANHVMEVLLDSKKSLLIPYIKNCILDVDLDKNTVLVHLLDGLLDI